MHHHSTSSYMYHNIIPSTNHVLVTMVSTFEGAKMPGYILFSPGPRNAKYLWHKVDSVESCICYSFHGCTRCPRPIQQDTLDLDRGMTLTCLEGENPNSDCDGAWWWVCFRRRDKRSGSSPGCKLAEAISLTLRQILTTIYAFRGVQSVADSTI